MEVNRNMEEADHSFSLKKSINICPSQSHFIDLKKVKDYETA